MTRQKPFFFLFPFTTLSETECRFLSLCFPALNILAVSRPIDIPAPCRTIARPWQTLEDEDSASAVSSQWRHYRELADIHGMESLQVSMARQWALSLPDENRHQIQDALKGSSPDSDLTGKKRLIVESGVFLELARDLDEKEMELEKDYRKVEAIEADFRKALGMEEEDILDEMVYSLNLSLKNEKSHRTFMLDRRMASWCRLVLPRLGGLPTALVTGERRVIDSVVDAAEAVCKRKGVSLELEETPLPPLPLPPWEEGRDELLSVNSLPSANELRQALEEMATAPEAAWRKTLSEVQGAWEVLTNRWGVPKPSHIFKMSIMSFKNCSLEELWSFWDRQGSLLQEYPEQAPPYPAVFFVYGVEKP